MKKNYKVYFYRQNNVEGFIEEDNTIIEAKTPKEARIKVERSSNEKYSFRIKKIVSVIEEEYREQYKNYNLVELCRTRNKVERDLDDGGFEDTSEEEKTKIQLLTLEKMIYEDEMGMRGNE